MTESTRGYKVIFRREQRDVIISKTVVELKDIPEYKQAKKLCRNNAARVTIQSRPGIR